MLDKRAIVRDQRIANLGLSRRIRLRIRPTPTVPKYNSDPTIDTQQNYNPNNDILKYVTGVFKTVKATQDPSEDSLYQEDRGIVYFHPIYKKYVDQCYSMYIGGTNKEWKKTSPAVMDESRSMLRVMVEASS